MRLCIFDSFGLRFVDFTKRLCIFDNSSSHSVDFTKRFGIFDILVSCKNRGKRLERSAQTGRHRTPNTAELLMNYHTNLPCPRQSRRRQTSLALKAHSAFNPEQARHSELLSRAKSLRSSRSSAHTNHSRITNELPHEPALPSSIETKADLACVESTPCFQP